MAYQPRTLIILSLLICLKITLLEGTDTCFTHGTNPGRCVQIELCPYLLDIAKSGVTTPAQRSLLNSRICGNKKEMPPNVCCEESSIIKTTESVSDTALLPGKDKCGLPYLGEKIKGGNRTGIGEFPWTVALEYLTEDPPAVLCGGSLINTRYVITAAHCVKKVQAEDLMARLGEWDLETDTDCDEFETCNPEVILAEIAEIKVNLQYRAKQNDIALLKLRNALPEDYYVHVQPICLPESVDLKQNLFNNQNVTVAGWGSTGEESSSRYKLYTCLTTIDLDKCQRELQTTSSKPKLTADNICAKSATWIVQDACQGDSGGPLMASVNGSWYLVGIVSFGSVCEGTANLPGVYVRVTSYMDWIKDNIKD